MNYKITLEELEITLNQMHLDKAPRPDGFSACFFEKCWHSIGTDLMDALESIRNLGKNLNDIKNNFITMIHKKENSESP